MRKFLVLLSLVTLAFCLAWASLVLADETVPPEEDGITGTEPPEETVEEPSDYAAALEEARAAIDGLAAAEKIKARLGTMIETRLREGAERGLSAEQLMTLARETTRLCAEVNLEGDLPHLNACCQLMIKAMRGSCTAEEVGAMISAKLAEGLDLKTALRQTRAELRGKTPREQQEKERKVRGKDRNKPEGAGQGPGKKK